MFRICYVLTAVNMYEHG